MASSNETNEFLPSQSAERSPARDAQPGARARLRVRVSWLALLIALVSCGILTQLGTSNAHARALLGEASEAPLRSTESDAATADPVEIAAVRRASRLQERAPACTGRSHAVGLRDERTLDVLAPRTHRQPPGGTAQRTPLRC